MTEGDRQILPILQLEVNYPFTSKMNASSKWSLTIFSTSNEKQLISGY